MSITLFDFIPSEEDILRIRKELYHSQGPGYFIVRNFLSTKFVTHLVEFWNHDIVAEKSHKTFSSKADFHFGCTNFFQSTSEKDKLHHKIYFNFLWNPPADEVAHSIAYNVQYLRNKIESRTPYSEIYPLSGNRCLSYRVCITKNGNIIVPRHQDWVATENFDPKRLQATLFLSEYNRDYTGSGFYLKNNQGSDVYFGKDIQVSPGDLVLWKYNNEHGVENVHSDPNQIGFMRMLFPLEVLGNKA